MVQQKDLDARVGESCMRSDCGHVGDYAKAEGYKRSDPEALMGMDLMDFFRKNSEIYDKANRYTHQALRKALDVMYEGKAYDPYWKSDKRIEKVADLYSITDADLYGNIPSFGAKSLANLNNALTKAGLLPVPRDGRSYYEGRLYSKPASGSVTSPSLK